MPKCATCDPFLPAAAYLVLSAGKATHTTHRPARIFEANRCGYSVERRVFTYFSSVYTLSATILNPYGDFST